MPSPTDEVSWEEPQDTDCSSDQSVRRSIVQWALTFFGATSLAIGLALASPVLPLPGSQPILATVLLVSVGVWLLRLAWQR